jgi:hypothetical protein
VERSCLALVMFALLSVSSAFGQFVAVRRMCDRDLLHFCNPAQSGGRLSECIDAHFRDFTEPCKAALVRIAPVLEACGADIQEQCPTIKPGSGRIFLCVRRRFASLSEACKDAIGHAAEQRLRDR